MSAWRIREERPDDAQRVYAIQEGAFGRPDEANLVDALRAAARPQLSLVAEQGGIVSGHVFFSPVSIEGAHASLPCAGLAPLAVLPALQGRGAGSLLVREGLSRCREIGWKAVFLLGNPAYYGRFGFELATPRRLLYEGDRSGAFFQVIELEPDVLQGCRGRVHYHGAFDDLS